MRSIARFRISPFFAFAACSVLAVLAPDAAAADPTALTIGPTGNLGTVDLVTGTLTSIGGSGLFSLGEIGGNLYSHSETTLYSVSAWDGSEAAIGSFGLSGASTGNGNIIDALGSTTAGLFGMDAPSGNRSHNLYSINPLTGAATLIGPTGIPDPGYGSGAVSNGGSTFYFADSCPNGNPCPSSDVLFSLNTTTGSATQIGLMGIGRTAGLVSIGGTLYAFDPSGVIYTVNTTTAQVTNIAAIPGAGFESYTSAAPQLITGYVDPKYVVMGVTYAPPGPSTNTWVQYLNSSFVGNTQQQVI